MDKENKCIECEEESLMELSSVKIELMEAQKYINLLEQCLDTKEELNKVLRNKLDEYKNKYELWKNKAIKDGE